MSEYLTLGLFQMYVENDFKKNLTKIIEAITNAKLSGCDVIVFPEGALDAQCLKSLNIEENRKKVSLAIEKIRRVANAEVIYVILCTVYPMNKQYVNRLTVINPKGEIIFDYYKLHDLPGRNSSKTFSINGVIASAIICADRWIPSIEDLPVMEGAKVIFECSGNYYDEWIDDLEWYWQVTRAVRNSVYVVFVNTSSRYHIRGHGHTAIIAPDGSIIDSLQEEDDRLLVAKIDISKASRSEALRRFNHPTFKSFWESGINIIKGKTIEKPTHVYRLISQKSPIKVAVAQMACSRKIELNLKHMKFMIKNAKDNNADIIAFPELVVTGAYDRDILEADRKVLVTALEYIRAVARQEKIYVIFGMPWYINGKRRNSAFVIDENGNILTRYDQIVVDKIHLFEQGRSTHSMWFTVKGVHSIVTIGTDVRWCEISKLAALRGAVLHFHICYDPGITSEAILKRKQFWATIANDRTLLATINAAYPFKVENPSSPAGGNSIIWCSFYRDCKWVSPEYPCCYSITRYPYTGVRLAEAGFTEQIIYGSEILGPENRLLNYLLEKDSQMKDWYYMGIRVIDISNGD
jgi:predicted amidohydrolase